MNSAMTLMTLYNESPDSLDDGKFYGFTGQFSEQAANGLVRFKALDGPEYIVLYHAQGQSRYLPAKSTHWHFPKFSNPFISL